MSSKSPGGPLSWSGIRSSRTKLLLATLPAICVVFVAVWSLATADARRGLQDLSGANLSLGSRNLADSLGRLLADAHADGSMAARLEVTAQAIDSHDPKAFIWFANQMLRSKQRYAAILVSDAKGLVVGANTADRNGKALPKVLGRQLGVTLPAGGGAKPAAIAFPLGRPSLLRERLGPGESVVGFTFPVVDIMDSTIGHLTLLISSVDVAAILDGSTSSSKQGVDSLAVLVDGEGKVVIAPSNLEGSGDWIGLVPASGAHAAGAPPWVGPRGGQYLVGQAALSGPAQEWRWRAVVLKAAATVEGPIDLISRRLMWAFLVGFLATAAILAGFATRMVRPLVRLTEAAAGGDGGGALGELRVNGDDEAARLTAAYNQMVARLRDNRRALEERAAAEEQDRRALEEKVDAVLHAVNGAVEGNLTVRVEIERSGAIGRVAEGLDRLFAVFHDHLRAISGSSTSLGESARTLSATSTQMGDASGRTATQAETVSSIVAAIRASVGQMTQGASQMSRSISDIAAGTQTASDIVDRTVAMVGEHRVLIRELGAGSAEIGGIVKLITNIAAQTNLLALNATIEAARAQEAGKGFAVVAHEVKELARGTAAATDDIARKVHSIQERIALALTAVEQIGEVVASVKEASSAIGSAVTHQSTITSEMEHSMVQTAQGIESIAGAAGAVAQSAGVVASCVSTTDRAATDLTSIADQLGQLVGRFEVAGDGGARALMPARHLA